MSARNMRLNVLLAFAMVLGLLFAAAPGQVMAAGGSSTSTIYNLTGLHLEGVGYFLSYRLPRLLTVMSRLGQQVFLTDAKLV